MLTAKSLCRTTLMTTSPMWEFALEAGDHDRRPMVNSTPEREGGIPTAPAAGCEPGARTQGWGRCSGCEPGPRVDMPYPIEALHHYPQPQGRQCLSNSPRRPREDHTPVLKNKVAKAPRKSKCIRQKSSQVWYPEHQHISCGIDPVCDVQG
jgi:hypothetical protein